MRFFTIIAAALFSVIGATDETLELEKGSMVCPGFPMSDYCNCGSSCGLNKCDCDDARKSTCCGDSGNITPTPTTMPTPAPGNIPPGAVLCPTLPVDDYCDCSNNCKNAPEWCSCAEARASGCCDQTLPEGAVQCPGLAIDDFCNCSDDCKNNDERCACSEGKTCCSGTAIAGDAVLCPGEPTTEYCDCSSDCNTVGSTRCYCSLAEDCCFQSNALRFS